MEKSGCTKRSQKPICRLLNALYDLKDEGVQFKLTIGVTPILGEQLSDPTIIEHFIGYAAERVGLG